MISDEMRHDVAHNLRALDMSDIDVDGCIIDSSKYVGLLLMRMLDVACDYRDGLHYFPGHFSAQAVVELFADLIDRQTCYVVEHKTHCGSYGCEEAGTLWVLSCGDECVNDSDFPPRYCPDCGARVVSCDD